MNRPLLIVVTLVAYTVVIAAVVWAMFDARGRMVPLLDTPQEQAHWDKARGEFEQRERDEEEFRRRTGDATNQPIEAKAPKERSPRPPALELLQNHFAACLATTLFGVTLLFIVIWGLCVGAILRPGSRFTPPEP